MRGIAHVSFANGGLFIPARSPYDRQMLIEHVVDRVRSKGQVQVLVDDERWMVHLRGNSAVNCAFCGLAGELACQSIGDEAATYCAHCAFGDQVELPDHGAPINPGENHAQLNRASRV
jgi:hypothetical protein